MAPKSAPKKSKKIPAPKPAKNNVPREEKIPKEQTVNSRLNDAQKQKLQSLILNTSRVRKTGNIITNRGQRITMMSYYLGLGGCVQQDIPEIA